jgi:hypothetical protein
MKPGSLVPGRSTQRKREFLDAMDRVVSRDDRGALIEPD